MSFFRLYLQKDEDTLRNILQSVNTIAKVAAVDNDSDDNNNHGDGYSGGHDGDSNNDKGHGDRGDGRGGGG